MTRGITPVLDAIAQWLTGLPLVWQTLVVAAVAIPACGVLAVLLLRAIDVAGAATYKLFNHADAPTAKLRIIPARRGHTTPGTRVVVDTPPRALAEETGDDPGDP
ncbi:hypothetical protein C1Y63_09030 [Corynebacterium sp. 13CS0277]|nr:hypothetical protein C1Y63_09030 [Corynebacterium sp. 13CS0277]